MRAVRAAAVTAKIAEMKRQRMAREAQGGERGSDDEGDEGEGDSSDGSGSSDESGSDDGVYEERAPNSGVLFDWLYSRLSKKRTPMGFRVCAEFCVAGILLWNIR
jgi:hypothetical protein